MIIPKIKTTNNSPYEFRHSRILKDLGDGSLPQSKVNELDWVLLSDPQHPNRQDCLDVANHSQFAEVTPVFPIRGYWFWESHTNWNPYKFSVIGPQWEMRPPPECFDVPGPEFNSMEYFWGHLDAAGYKNITPYREMFYLQHSAGADGWKDMEPFTFRPSTWEMRWNSDEWQNILAEYHADYAEWVDSHITNKNPRILLLNTTKAHHYWYPTYRIPRMSPPKMPPESNGKTGFLLHYMHPDFNWKFNHDPDNLSGSHVAFPATNQRDWLRGNVGLLRTIRHEFDHNRKLRHWKLAWDMEYTWAGRTGASLLEICGGGEEARSLVEGQCWEAARHCDIIIWPDTNLRAIAGGSEVWIDRLQSQMGETCDIVNEVKW